jgi:serine/threonine-protein kinase
LFAAAKTYRQALDAERQLLGPAHASTRIIHSNLLGVMERQGQFADALRERREMLRTGKTASDAMRDDSIALVTQLIAFDYRELGQLDDAEAAAREALATWRRIESSADTVDSAPPLENLGVILYLQGRNAEAEVTLRQAIAIMHQHASPSSQWVARMRGELADTLRREHRYAEALREASQASAVLAAALSTSQEANPVLAVLEAQRSEAQLDAGDVAGAEQTGADALVLSRRALPANNYRLGAALFALARAKLARNRPDAAEALLREALYVRRPPHPAHDPRVLEVEAALADALAHQGKTDAARKLRGDLDARLDASKSPYATELRARLSRR